jgi:hypothetical protein
VHTTQQATNCDFYSRQKPSFDIDGTLTVKGLADMKSAKTVTANTGQSGIQTD